MIVKVCGIIDQNNLEELISPGIDMIGINFYQSSKRFINHTELSSPSELIRVGVFVNHRVDEILQSKLTHVLDYAQLHGDEEENFCSEVNKNIPIIKVFRITPDFHWTDVHRFSFAKYFLFDTHTKHFGGSGKKFDWNILAEYDGSIPFLLSGGIGPDDAEIIKKINHPMFKGIDINSQFELSPGIKDVSLVHKFIKEIRA